MFGGMSSCPTAAQTLARPGWTAPASEPWWRNAVFYRIAPEHFQDSDGDDVGDLRGVAQRLDYLQALGVDAVVLQLPFDDAGFDDLLGEASHRHVRLVIGLDRGPAGGEGGAAAERGGGKALVEVASHWLARGAAGILLPPPPARAEATDAAEQMRRDVAEPLLLLALRRAAARLPGERVVIPTSAAPVTGPGEPIPGSRGPRPGGRALRPGEPQLVLGTLPLGAAEAATASAVLASLTMAMPGDSAPLLQLHTPGRRPEEPRDEADTPSEANGDTRIAAAALLTQRSAVLLEYGEELGFPAPARMPWTPTNVTPAPEPPPEAAQPPVPPAEVVYGPYRPYIPPPPKPEAAPPPPASDPNLPSLPDPATLPGFSTKTAGDVPSGSAIAADTGSGDAGGVSVALQERDPRSLLSLYRRLLALHHGNAALRSGSLELLTGDETTGDKATGDRQAVAWLRRPPADARTVAAVVVAVNCGEHPIVLSLEAEFARLHLGEGALRSLLSGGQILGSRRLTLAPHAVFVGEFVRGY